MCRDKRDCSQVGYWVTRPQKDSEYSAGTYRRWTVDRTMGEHRLFGTVDRLPIAVALSDC